MAARPATASRDTPLACSPVTQGLDGPCGPVWLGTNRWLKETTCLRAWLSLGGEFCIIWLGEGPQLEWVDSLEGLSGGDGRRKVWFNAESKTKLMLQTRLLMDN